MWQYYDVCVCVCYGVFHCVTVCVCVFQTNANISSITSTELEEKFQNNPQEAVSFTAGSQAYTLSFQGEPAVTAHPPTHQAVAKGCGFKPQVRSRAGSLACGGC